MKQKLADFFNLLYSFRNIILWILLFGVSIIFRLKSYIDGAQFVDMCKSTFLGLVAVHGSEHIVAVVQAYYNSAKGTQTAPPADNVAVGEDK